MKSVNWVDINGNEQEVKVEDSIPYSSQAAIIEEVVSKVLENGYKPYMLEVAMRTSVYHEYTDYIVKDVDEMMREKDLWAKVSAEIEGEYRVMMKHINSMIKLQTAKSGLDMLAEYFLGEAKKEKTPMRLETLMNEQKESEPMN